MTRERLTAAQRKLVEDHVGLVPQVARRVFRNSHRLIDEHAGAGYLGLCDAAISFDPDHGLPFAAYARFRIAGEMRDCARQAFGRSNRARVRLVSIDHCGEGVASSTDVDEDVADLVLAQLESHRARLSDREQQVLRDYYEHGLTMAAIGASLGITESGVCRIIRRATDRLRAVLGVVSDDRPARERILAELVRGSVSATTGSAIDRLARRARVRPATCADLLRVLRADGLVVCERGVDPRSFGHIAITDAGRDELERVQGQRAA